MYKFFENLAALLKVKTIVTLLLTIVFCVLALTGVISGADFLTVFTVVIAFYFGTQQAKAQPEDPPHSAQLLSGTLNEDATTPIESPAPESTMHATKPPDNA